MYFNLLLLAAVVVFIVDISGIIDAAKSALGRWIGIRIERLKPLDCSLCMTWWAGLVYLLIIGRLTLGPVAFVALLASCSIQIAGVFRLAGELLQWLTDRGFRMLEK